MIYCLWIARITHICYDYCQKINGGHDMKRIMKSLLVITFLFLVSMTSFAGSWNKWLVYTFYSGSPGNPQEEIPVQVRQVSNESYSVTLNGSSLKNQWLGFTVNDNPALHWRYYDEKGEELSGWQSIAGNWYYFTAEMQTDWKRVNQNDYYFDPVTGIMQTSGTAMKNGCTYEFSADGLSVKIDGLVYAGENGTEGWKQEGQKWYYLRNGEKVTNEWLFDGNDKYYIGADGAKCTRQCFIDGDFYQFVGNGIVYTGGGHTFYRDKKYYFGEGGKGIPAEMDAEERMYCSDATQWCQNTFEIYSESVHLIGWDNITPGLDSLLERDWGITTKEECLEMINLLFEAGKATDDKATKAWNFSRAMLLCRLGRIIDWWDHRYQMDLQLPMAPTIQQSFASWDDFNDSYMSGFTRWSGGSGELYERRVRAYERLKAEDYFMDVEWNASLAKTW